LSVWIDQLFAWLKWPAAVLAVALLPASVLAFIQLLAKVATHPLPVTMILTGIALYLVAWWWVFRRWRFAFFMTVEHELTHALFALATFHRVTGLRATAFRGGQMRFVGQGNWLITVAPYFFPTLSLFLIVLARFLPGSLASVANLVVGASFAFHVTSTLRETHPGQTDLQEAGFVFCLLFLPTANILTFGAMLAFVYGGWSGAGEFLGAIGRTTWGFFN